MPHTKKRLHKISAASQAALKAVDDEIARVLDERQAITEGAYSQDQPPQRRNQPDGSGQRGN